MKVKLSTIKFLVLAVLFTLMSTAAFAATEDFKELPSKSEISINKPWTVKVNLDLDKSTINNTNVMVKNSEGNSLKVTVYPGKDSKSIVIYPQVGGYIPGAKYSLELGTGIRSIDGKKMSKPLKMSFTTSNQYEDTTSYEALPSIKGIDILDGPILKNSKTNFKVAANYSGEVQYRAFVLKYPNEVYDNSNVYANVEYTELTTGYSTALNASMPYIFSKKEGFEAGKYKLLVYIKTKGKTGQYKDINTDFDNYSSINFKVIDKNILQDIPINATIIRTEYNKTLQEAAAEQNPKGAPIYSESTGFMKASNNQVGFYMNPNNFLDDYGKYYFLVLNYMEVSAEDLNTLLKGKGVLDGKGGVFLKAAKENDVNPIYLVSHALLETGNGTSKLSNGILVSSVDGNPVEPKTTYNMFGVKAFDEDPNRLGSEYAYKEGWFTIDEAIIGGAEYIGSNYINRIQEKQNTLYKMKWDINCKAGWYHQYATDIGWPVKQIKRIKELVEQCKSAKPVFDIPKFK